MSTIQPLHENHPFVGQLHSEIQEVLKQEKYDDLPVATLIGVLEFVKFNLINNC
jgi:hypothetical protein